MNFIVGALIALIGTAAVFPSSKPVVDPLIAGVAIGGIAGPIATAAGVTGTVAGTSVLATDAIAVGAGVAAAGAVALSD